MPKGVWARPTAEERLWGKVDVRGEDECWPYTGQITDAGYGRFWLGYEGGYTTAHRAAYRFAVGEPSGVVDHQCHNEDPGCPGGPACLHRQCCNPAHLEDTDSVENMRRGKGANSRGVVERTICARGHEFDEANTYVRPDGRRECRACNLEDYHRRRG